MKSLFKLNPPSILTTLIVTTAISCGKTDTLGAATGSGGLANSAGGATTCPAGNERCACYGNNTCNGRLQCFSNVCVDTSSSSGGAAPTSASATGGIVSIEGTASSSGGVVTIGSSLSTAGAFATGGQPATGGTSSAAGGTIATGGKATGGAPTGGTKATGGSQSVVACGSLTVPTGTGSLSVTGGYTTAGALKGYAFTYIGTVLNNSGVPNSTTCITPTCDTTGCRPTFGSTALCASGVATADSTYNTVAGMGFNLNQDSSGATNGTVAAPANVTVTTKLGSNAGDAKVRIVLVDASDTKYCAESGQWTSGTPIPITTFNTQCWDPTQPGTVYLSAGNQIRTILLEVPSSMEADRPFSMCLTGVTFS